MAKYWTNNLAIWSHWLLLINVHTDTYNKEGTRRHLSSPTQLSHCVGNNNNYLLLENTFDQAHKRSRFVLGKAALKYLLLLAHNQAHDIDTTHDRYYHWSQCMEKFRPTIKMDWKDHSVADQSQGLNLAFILLTSLCGGQRDLHAVGWSEGLCTLVEQVHW